VARATRERILAAADELAYVYNRRAASMRTRRSHTVGLLIPGLANPFFGALVQAVEEELAPSGYTLLLANTLEDRDRQAELIRTFLEYRVDGVLVVPAIGTRASAFDFLKQDGTPTVLLTRHVQGLKSDWVGSDDAAGGALAASHLLEHGCARLAYFGGPVQVYARSQRSDAFAEAVRSHGAELDERWCVGTATSSSAGYEAARALLQAGDPPEGIACHSDAIAFGLIRALTERGHTVGEAVRVIGFDDVEHARISVPSLSSISVSSDQMGRSAARLLISRTQEPAGGQITTSVFEPSLRARESCGHHDR
jgi:LacI family transcriptional regulator